MPFLPKPESIDVIIGLAIALAAPKPATARPVARPDHMLIKEMHFTHEGRDRPNSQ